MPYIRPDGTVVNSRSNFRISILSDIFWTILNTVELFFRTLINPKANIPRKKKSDDIPPRKLGPRGNGGPNIKSLPKDCPKGG